MRPARVAIPRASATFRRTARFQSDRVPHSRRCCFCELLDVSRRSVHMWCDHVESPCPLTGLTTGAAYGARTVGCGEGPPARPHSRHSGQSEQFPSCSRQLTLQCPRGYSACPSQANSRSGEKNRTHCDELVRPAFAFPQVFWLNPPVRRVGCAAREQRRRQRRSLTKTFGGAHHQQHLQSESEAILRNFSLTRTAAAAGRSCAGGDEVRVRVSRKCKCGASCCVQEENPTAPKRGR